MICCWIKGYHSVGHIFETPGAKNKSLLSILDQTRLKQQPCTASLQVGLNPSYKKLFLKKRAVCHPKLFEAIAQQSRDSDPPESAMEKRRESIIDSNNKELIKN
jgi:hypothetical protein